MFRLGHLAADAGAGLLTCGVVALAAAVWLRRESVIVATVAMAAFAGPHALFHVTHPADALSTTVDVVNGIVLVAFFTTALIVMAAAVSAPGRLGLQPPDHSTPPS